MNHKILKALEFHAKMPYSVINIFKRQSPNFVNREMKAACVAAESNTGCYVTYRLRSKAMTYGDLFYPYCLADFLYFGYIEDIEELFSLPLDKRQKGEYGNGKTRRKVAEEMIAPEIQFLREYIRRMGGNNECTVKSYWQFTKNHLVTINKDEIGLFWPKYEGRHSENTQNGSYYLNEEENAFRCYNFDFIRWLNLYQGTLKYDQKYEEYAEFIL